MNSPIDPITLYQKVLPLLYHNPDGIRPSSRLNEVLRPLIQYDAYQYYVLDPNNLAHTPGMTVYHGWPECRKLFSDMKSSPFSNEDPDVAFDEGRRITQENLVRRKRQQKPEMIGYYYHELISREAPMAMVGFFRYRALSWDNSFSEAEIQLLNELAPDLFMITRLLCTSALRSKEYQHLQSYTQIVSTLASKYCLSDMEYTIATEIVSGKTNEEIADRNFISVSTVKTHVQHILKKTATKNRVDFISKFFTSPQRLEL